MTTEESKFEILKKVQEGLLSPAEGADLLGILAGETKQAAESTTTPAAEVELVGSSVDTGKPAVSAWWKAAWSSIMWLGVLITILSAYGMYRGYEAAGFGWGFFLSWIPFALGIVLTYAGARLMEAHWMHIKVNAHDHGNPQSFNIEAPLPLSFASWIFKNFGEYMPADVRERHIDEILDEIERSMQGNEPFQVQVDDHKNGDKVEVLIA